MLFEYVKYNSLKQATDYHLLNLGADEEGVKASRSEVALSIESLIPKYKLKNKKELKVGISIPIYVQPGR